MEILLDFDWMPPFRVYYIGQDFDPITLCVIPNLMTKQFLGGAKLVPPNQERNITLNLCH